VGFERCIIFSTHTFSLKSSWKKGTRYQRIPCLSDWAPFRPLPPLPLPPLWLCVCGSSFFNECALAQWLSKGPSYSGIGVCIMRGTCKKPFWPLVTCFFASQVSKIPRPCKDKDPACAFQLSDSSSGPPCIVKQGRELTIVLSWYPKTHGITQILFWRTWYYVIACWAAASIHPSNLLHHLQQPLPLTQWGIKDEAIVI